MRSISLALLLVAACAEEHNVGFSDSPAGPPTGSTNSWELVGDRPRR